MDRIPGVSEIALIRRRPLRRRRVEAEFRCTDRAKEDLRQVADALNMSIGQLLDAYAAKKYGERAS